MIPRLYAIANVDQIQSPTEYVGKLLDAGVRCIQIRAKELSRPRLKSIVESAVELATPFVGATIIVNDDIELARETRASGVHLGQSDCSPSLARSILGQHAIVGLSTHNLQQLAAAPFPLLSYVALGPIFHSKTKSGHAPEVGIDTLRQATLLSPIPLVAIGGITPENARAVFSAGASSIACIEALANSANLRATVAAFLDNNKTKDSQS